nr:hypothetical protein StreXyl84_06030 [Streptomyces sp. Xyl84]
MRVSRLASPATALRIVTGGLTGDVRELIGRVNQTGAGVRRAAGPAGTLLAGHRADEGGRGRRTRAVPGPGTGPPGAALPR